VKRDLIGARKSRVTRQFVGKRFVRGEKGVRVFAGAANCGRTRNHERDHAVGPQLGRRSPRGLGQEKKKKKKTLLQEKRGSQGKKMR